MKRILCMLLVLIQMFCLVQVTYADEFDSIRLLSVAQTASEKTPDGIFGLSVYKDYVYAAARKSGLKIFDVSNREKPIDITPDEDIYKGTTIVDAPNAIYVYEDMLYVGFDTISPSGKGGKGVRKYDLTNPQKPELVVTYEATRASSILMYNDVLFVADRGQGLKLYKGDNSAPYKIIAESVSKNVTDIAVNGKFMYVSYTNGGVLVYSLHDMNNIILCTSLSINGTYTLVRIIATDDAIYLMDMGAQYIYIIDLKSVDRDLARLGDATVVRTSLSVSETYWRDMHYCRGHLYVNDTENMYVVDVSEPTKLKLANIFRVKPGDFSQCFGAKVVDDYIYISDRVFSGFGIYTNTTPPKGNEFTEYEITFEKLKAANAVVEEITFNDIKGSNYKNDINMLAEKCIVSGDGNGDFKPTNTATYAEFLATIMKSANLNPVECSEYADPQTQNEWYSGYFNMALNAGIIDKEFCKYTDEISRKDAALITYNIYKYVSGKVPDTNKNENASDISDLSDEYKQAVVFLVEGKMLSLNKEKRVRPEAILTREEMAGISAGFIRQCEGAGIKLTGLKQAPILLRTTDAVTPGEIFSVYGDGVFAEEFKAVVDYLDSDMIPVKPTESAVELKAEYIDEDGQFASFVFPENMKKGVYVTWVHNKYGWSNPMVINRARPLFMTTDQIAAGNEAYVIGRNFDLKEIGLETKTVLRLTGANGSYNAKITELNPFAVCFTVDESVPQGEYHIDVSSDGKIFTRIDEDLPFYIKKKAYDPYGLGVSWASEFNWNNKVNVKDFGAKGDGKTYDTKAIQKAIDSVADAGGVVYFPKGTYIIESLLLPGHVVLAGDSMEESILMYRGDSKNRKREDINNDTIIQTDKARRGNDGRQGMVQLALVCDTSVGAAYQPKFYFWLATADWPSRNGTIRHGDYVFIKKCQIGQPAYDWATVDKDFDFADNHWSTYCIIQMNKNLLFEDNKLLGDRSDLTSSTIKKFYSIRNNYIKSMCGNLYVTGENSIFENNTVIRAPWDIGPDFAPNARQGIYTSNNSYVAHNTIENTGTIAGDGEIIALENYSGGDSIIGDVVSAGSKSIKIKPYVNGAGFEYSAIGFTVMKDGEWNFDFNKPRGTYAIKIIGGKGVGQIRSVVSGDRQKKLINISEPWTIIPDSTSKFVIYLPTDNFTVYDNTLKNGSWAILVYSSCNDSAICNNKGIDTGGIDLTGLYNYEGSQSSDRGMYMKWWNHYFSRIENNTFEGYSWKNSMVAIGLNGKWQGGDAVGLMYYGVDIKNNSIRGDNRTPEDVIAHTAKITEMGGQSQYYQNYNGIYIRFANDRKQPFPEDMHIKAVHIQDNKMIDLDRGITLGGDSYYQDAWSPDYSKNLCKSQSTGVIIKDNSFNNVDKPYVRNGDVGTVILDDTAK